MPISAKLEISFYIPEESTTITASGSLTTGCKINWSKADIYIYKEEVSLNLGNTAIVGDVERKHEAITMSILKAAAKSNSQGA